MWDDNYREERPNECNICGMAMAERKSQMNIIYVGWPLQRPQQQQQHLRRSCCMVATASEISLKKKEIDGICKFGGITNITIYEILY